MPCCSHRTAALALALALVQPSSDLCAQGDNLHINHNVRQFLPSFVSVPILVSIPISTPSGTKAACVPASERLVSDGHKSEALIQASAALDPAGIASGTGLRQIAR